MRIHLDQKIAYAYTGTKPLAAQQRTIVFVHGAANDHSVWSLQSRYFAYHGFNVLALDLPGHGRSQGPPLTSVQDMADWAVRLLDAVSIDRATFVGHSMGSLIALEAAARYPGRVAQLALIATAFPMKVSDALLSAASAGEHAALEMINVWSHSADGQRGGNRVPGQWIMGASLRLLERTSDTLHTDFTACDRYSSGEISAAKVTCPVLVIAGSRDVMTPPLAARALMAELTNVRSIIVAGSGHDLMTEQPDAVLDALIAFI